MIALLINIEAQQFYRDVGKPPKVVHLDGDQLDMLREECHVPPGHVVTTYSGMEVRLTMWPGPHFSS